MRKAFLGERIGERFYAQEKMRAEPFPVRNRLEQKLSMRAADVTVHFKWR